MNKNLAIGLLTGALIIGGGIAVFNMSKTADNTQTPPGVPLVNPSPSSAPNQTETPVAPGTPTPPTTPPQAGAPTVQTGTTAVPSISTAVLTGNVNPNGSPTSYWYEYGETTSLGTRTNSQTIGSGFSSVYAPAYITGLKANTTYYYKLSARNQTATVNGSTYSFRTNNTPAPQALAPTTRTLAATNISSTSANLHGRINPNNSETTYWFEYGETNNLGNITAFQSASGDTQTDVSISILNLKPQARYFFRLNSQNQYGTVNGEILSFTTGS